MSLTAVAEPNWTLSEPPGPQAPSLPCWLTEVEAEALLMLCATSRLNGGTVEHEIFGKLGDLLRAFRR